MSYNYINSRLVYPPACAPLPNGSVYFSKPFACADFINDKGQTLSLSFNELRCILVHKNKNEPAIPREELRKAFRDSIRITPHSHSDVTAKDVIAAFNSSPSLP